MARHKRGVVGGSKMNNKHQTYVETAERVILAAKAMPEVRKVVLGEIKPARNGRAAITCKEIPAGLMLKVRAVRACQTLYIFTSDAVVVAAGLRALF